MFLHFCFIFCKRFIGYTSVVGVEMLDDVTHGDSCNPVVRSLREVFERGNVCFIGGVEYLLFQGGIDSVVQLEGGLVFVVIAT